jgi:hypothetical protein
VPQPTTLPRAPGKAEEREKEEKERDKVPEGTRVWKRTRIMRKLRREKGEASFWCL